MLKPKKENQRKTPLILINVFFALSLLLSSCTYFKKGAGLTWNKINESTKENVAAAKIANEKTEAKILETKVNIENTNYLGAQLSIEGAMAANSISTVFLTRAQNLIGLPLEPQAPVINNLLSTNTAIRRAEEKRQEIKQENEIELRAKLQELENKLIDYGKKYEEDRNTNIVKKTWGWLTATLGIGGIIALCVFFPFLIPIFGQILAKIIALIPSLAHGVGVVATKTFKNTSLAIGEIRHNLKKEKELQPAKTYTPAEVLEMLDTELKIHLDGDDKEIVKHFRKKHNL